MHAVTASRWSYEASARGRCMAWRIGRAAVDGAQSSLPCCRSLVHVVLLGSALASLSVVVVAAPFPAHLVVHGGQHHGHHVAWQEFPVALHRGSNSTPFKPILPGTDHGLYNEGFFEGDIQRHKGQSTKDPDVRTRGGRGARNQQAFVGAFVLRFNVVNLCRLRTPSRTPTCCGPRRPWFTRWTMTSVSSRLCWLAGRAGGVARCIVSS